ncbi:MAG: YeeE/YedE family protein [Ilumatobacteraceae bacterium]|nr:YeeE/YedE family protein [Ilumatobacteraceae bacterium]
MTITSAKKAPLTFAAAALSGIVVVAFVLSRGVGSDPGRPVSLLIGAALGVAFERGRFCFFCMFREAFEERQTRQLNSIVTAIAVGAIGYALLFSLYLPNPKGEGLPPAAHISPVSLPLVLGAFAFGIGMVLSGACISGHLYRIGQGYLRAIPALMGSLVGFGLGFFTWNTLYLEQVSESPVWWLPRWFGYSGSLLIVLVVAVIVAALLVKWDRSPDDTTEASGPRRLSGVGDVYELLLVRRWSPVATGAIVGGIGIAAYLRTTPLGVTSQLSTLSRSYLDAQGALPEVLHGIDMMRGCVALVTTAITNNGWLIIGFVVASLAMAVGGGRFSVQKPTVGNSATALLGGVLLGWGSLTALGCTVGVLLSGTQAFAVSGIVFLVVVAFAVWVGTKLRLHRLFGA